jgi:hypothetical protein
MRFSFETIQLAMTAVSGRRFKGHFTVISNGMFLTLANLALTLFGLLRIHTFRLVA